MKRKVETIRGTMAKEIQKHMDICVERSESFYGREDDLYRIKMYLTGSLKRSFLIHGQVGCGKTSLLSKIATTAKDWLSQKVAVSNLKVIVVVRFLGSTPISSSIYSVLLSICQQLCYNLEIPIEEIPLDFVPLKNYFKLLLEKSSKNFFTVILLGKRADCVIL